MKERGKIFLVRPTEPNRGDMLSRYGLLKRLKQSGETRPIIVISRRSASELPCSCHIVRPGPLKDILPCRQQMRLYSRGDEVWWACGHDLQDDSSLMKLPFLIVKFLFFRLMGMRVRIIAQGAGPIATPFGRLCVRAIMALVQDASFRDEESLSLVRRVAPAAAAKTRVTCDQALFASGDDEMKSAADTVRPLIVGVNVRRWGHFDGHWLPYEYRVRLGLLREIPGESDMNEFIARLAKFLDEQVSRNRIKIRAIPMYPSDAEPWEDDLLLLERMKNRMEHGGSVEILGADLSPARLLDAFRELDVMIGARLHSTIAATMMGKPSIHLSYSPKGESYFKTIGQERFCHSLDALLQAQGWQKLREDFEYLLENRTAIGAAIKKRIGELKRQTGDGLRLERGITHRGAESESQNAIHAGGAKSSAAHGIVRT